MPDGASAFPRFESEAGRARYMAAYDAALDAWPVPWEAREISTRLGRTHLIVSGPSDGPPLVLLPSFAASALVWRLNIAELSRVHRTYCVDVIGQPGKSMATRRIRSRREYADWLVDVLDGLGVQRTSIVGCSFGGFLAVNQASLTPDRVDRVVLVGPAGIFASQYWKLVYAMRIRGPMLALVRRFASKNIANNVPAPVRRPPRDLKWAALMAVTMSESPDVSVINASVFNRTVLRAIRAPTLLLIGDAEQLYEPHAALKLAQARMSGLEGAIVADADHIAAMAQPDEVNARIIRFLQSR